METLSSTPLDSPRARVVEAPTLKEALRLVRQRYGDDARVIRSRTVNRRLRGLLGSERVVEVLVEPPAVGSERGGHGPNPARAPLTTTPVGGRPLTAEIAAEVERIETLVRQLTTDHHRPARARPLPFASPVAEAMVGAGADPDVVARLLDRFVAETGHDAGDRTAVLTYLTQCLQASGGRWEDFGGCHVFLGPAGAGKTEIVLETAARLQQLGRQVLVLALLPRHGGEVRRLQIEAARLGYDAAILQKPEQLAASEQHLSRYEAVLVDTPAWDVAPFATASGMREHIVRNSAYHRHLVCPLDRDLRDAQLLVAGSREWNCDWTALTRIDQVSRPGKLLDLLEQLPLPVSLLNRGPTADGGVAVADAGQLIDLVLTGASSAEAVSRRTARG
jgi:flagellar biosynthesis GTPase FlhF